MQKQRAKLWTPVNVNWQDSIEDRNFALDLPRALQGISKRYNFSPISGPIGLQSCGLDGVSGISPYGVRRIKPSMSKVGVMDDHQRGFQEKKDRERKLTLRSAAINDCLKALPQIVSARSMNMLIRKEGVEWSCIFTMAKGEPMSHAGEAKKQPLEIR